MEENHQLLAVKGERHPICDMRPTRAIAVRGERVTTAPQIICKVNNKTSDLDWYYSRHNQKLEFLVCDSVVVLCMPFTKTCPSHSIDLNILTVRYFGQFDILD